MQLYTRAEKKVRRISLSLFLFEVLLFSDFRMRNYVQLKNHKSNSAFNNFIFFLKRLSLQL